MLPLFWESDAQNTKVVYFGLEVNLGTLLLQNFLVRLSEQGAQDLGHVFYQKALGNGVLVK